MFYTIYKVTNQINGQFYVGSHKTKDLNDGYMGSDMYLKRGGNLVLVSCKVVRRT